MWCYSILHTVQLSAGKIVTVIQPEWENFVNMEFMEWKNAFAADWLVTVLIFTETNYPWYSIFNKPYC